MIHDEADDVSESVVASSEVAVLSVVVSCAGGQIVFGLRSLNAIKFHWNTLPSERRPADDDCPGRMSQAICNGSLSQSGVSTMYNLQL